MWDDSRDLGPYANSNIALSLPSLYMTSFYARPRSSTKVGRFLMPALGHSSGQPWTLGVNYSSEVLSQKLEAPRAARRTDQVAEFSGSSSQTARSQLAGGRKFLALGTLSGAPTLLGRGTDHIWTPYSMYTRTLVKWTNDFYLFDLIFSILLEHI